MKKIFVIAVLVLAIFGYIFAAGCTSPDTALSTTTEETPVVQGIVKPYDFDPQTIGILEVDSEPRQAMVWVDGEYKSTTYATIRDQWVGVHSVKLTKEGYEDYNTEVTINPDSITKITVTLNKIV